jgi:hypothetical protein
VICDRNSQHKLAKDYKLIFSKKDNLNNNCILEDTLVYSGKPDAEGHKWKSYKLVKFPGKISILGTV